MAAIRQLCCGHRLAGRKPVLNQIERRSVRKKVITVDKRLFPIITSKEAAQKNLNL